MTDTAAKFDRILDLEAEVRIARTVAECQLAGVPTHRREQQATAAATAPAKLAAAIDALTPEELAAFGAYRREALA